MTQLLLILNRDRLKLLGIYILCKVCRKVRKKNHMMMWNCNRGVEGVELRLKGGVIIGDSVQ
jgi:hypothetical protein